MEPAVQHHRAAGEKGGQQCNDLRVDVEQRQRVESAIRVGELVMIGDAAGGVQQLVLGEHHHPGCTGRS
jgi:hypothetical protein